MTEPKYKFTYLTGYKVLKRPKYRIEPRHDGPWIKSDSIGLAMGPFESASAARVAILACGGEHQPNEGEG